MKAIRGKRSGCVLAKAIEKIELLFIKMEKIAGEASLEHSTKSLVWPVVNFRCFLDTLW